MIGLFFSSIEVILTYRLNDLPPRYKWLGKFHRFKDWTAGCIAVSNKEMEEIYEACKIGAVVEIYP